ncbi:MAG TPA: glycoside hydrolase family 2 TIM barrel-domain containing protein [Anaerolineae bacterium]|nr:glycoside hydrolase family 2 TIM barrel-domain containing protein [Anaerolineae bacterium]HOQ99061.1 glycoside hydrolase family 2 TIM barrel-domain containing protein [Anaerolineae bacterium]
MDIPRPEYPRPDLRRAEWRNLNGFWDFAFDDHNEGLSQGWHERGPFSRQIVVPFPFESALSGIGDPTPHPSVWYRTTFNAQRPPAGERLLLHLGAVDWEATVWLNGRELGRHRGGYVPFSFDVTGALQSGENTLVVHAIDTLSKDQPRGKQYWDQVPSGIWYDRTSGIWQTVWLEPVPASHIGRLQLTPNVDAATLHVAAEVDGDATGLSLEAVALDGGQEVAREVAAPGNAGLDLRLPQPRLWSPEAPHLYDLQVSLRDGGRPVDRVESYFGLRKVTIDGKNILLNDRPLYQRLVLDQGYWPDGQYTAPSDEALRADILWGRRFGYNGARKHQKVEDPRWLYWCDRLGYLVWGEMANCGLYHYSPQAVANVRDEWREAVARDYNHPCIVTWVPFNESWGIWGVRERAEVQQGVRDVVRWTRSYDPTRPVIDNSGWEHLDTDIADLHTYLRTGEQVAVWWPCYRSGQTYVYDSNYPFWAQGQRYGGQPVVVSEYGGMAIEEYPPPPDKPLQACGLDPLSRYAARYHDLTRAILDLEDVCGFCFTQLTDVEGEVNGVLTYGRRPKVDPDVIAAYNREAPAAYPISKLAPERACRR